MYHLLLEYVRVADSSTSSSPGTLLAARVQAEKARTTTSLMSAISFGQVRNQTVFLSNGQPHDLVAIL
jgi:hypothetical protein